MAKSATFSVVNASGHSSNHNSRDDIPEYLIGIYAGEENVYDLRHSNSQFLELAQAKYKEMTGQKMQQKQIDALIKETVLSLENHHTKADVQKVFDQLNEKYGGHYITELSIHKDEGHFEDKNGVTYYPTKDILKKEDGWYIVPLDQSLEMKPSYKPKEHEFSEKVDINDFKPIHNIHAHVKFSMFDLNTGKTGRMKHNELNDRIKTAAHVLKLEYNPEKGSKKRTPVEQIKTQHKAVRNEKIKALAKGLKSEQSLGEKYDSLPIAERLEMRKEMREILGENSELTQAKEELAKEVATNKDLSAENKKLREQLKEHGATRADYAQLEQLNKDLRELIKQKDLTIDDLKSIHKEFQEQRAIPDTHDLEKSIKDITETYSDQRSQSNNEHHLLALKSDFLHAEFNNAERIIDNSKEKGMFGEKINEAKLKIELEKALNKRDEIIKESFSLSERVLQSGKSLIKTFESIKENTKIALGAFISKIQGKSMPEEEKEQKQEQQQTKKRGMER